MGTTGTESVDYPDFAHVVAGRVEQGDVRRGVLLCGTGLGMSYAANRHHGVRAAVAWTPEIAQLGAGAQRRQCARPAGALRDEDEGVEILQTWLNTPFDGGRHGRRMAKIDGAADEPRSQRVAA